MIGNGYNRGSEIPSQGYNWGSGTSKRWGTNTIDGRSSLNGTYGKTDVLVTDFDNVNGQAQGASFDSGGGVFVNNGGTWELAGIMIGISRDTAEAKALYGDETYSADLSSYATQINTQIAVPEPAVMSILLLLGGGIWFVRRWFR